MRKLITVALILICAGILTGQTKKQIGEPELYSTYNNWVPELSTFLRGTRAAEWFYAFNARGDTLKENMVVVWADDSTSVVDIAESDGVDTLTIADSLCTNRWWQIKWFADEAVANGSLDVYGKDSAFATQVETLVINGAAASIAWSTYLWREIDLAVFRNASTDSTHLIAYPYRSVTTTTSGADPTVAGVVHEQALDDSLVKVFFFGFHQILVKASATAAAPGLFLQTTTTAGYAVPNATPAAGKGIGKLQESGNTDGAYWAFICPAY